MNLTVIILTFNEERNLPACLESLDALNCETIVVDSGSTDRTIEIARSAGAQIAAHAFENYAAQRNWAQENLPIHTEWVLHLDADERLTPELVTEIRERLGRAGSKEHGAKSEELRARSAEVGAGHTQFAISHKPGFGEAESGRREALEEIDGFLLRKRTFFMGRWIRHGGHYPSYHLRLFRKEKGCCEDRLYDQHFIVEGNIAKLKHDYVDVLTSDLNTWTQRHVRWAELEAREIFFGDNGNAQVRPSFFGNPIERRRWLRTGLYGRSPLFVRAFAYWIYRYFLRLGFLDGKEGFIFHFLQGFWFRLLVDIRIDELRREKKPETRDQRSEIRS